MAARRETKNLHSQLLFGKLVTQPYMRACMLTVTSRGVGFSTALLNQVVENMGCASLEVPSIYAQYRVYLAVFEARIVDLRRNYPKLLHHTDFIYKHRGITLEFERLIRNRLDRLPSHMAAIVSSIDIINYGEEAYIPVVAEVRDAQGKVQPRPETVLICNLRNTVEELANEQTPLAMRLGFENNWSNPWCSMA